MRGVDTLVVRTTVVIATVVPVGDDSFVAVLFIGSLGTGCPSMACKERTLVLPPT
jgi:hypothetical protein